MFDQIIMFDQMMIYMAGSFDNNVCHCFPSEGFPRIKNRAHFAATPHGDDCNDYTLSMTVMMLNEQFRW